MAGIVTKAKSVTHMDGVVWEEIETVGSTAKVIVCIKAWALRFRGKRLCRCWSAVRPRAKEVSGNSGGKSLRMSTVCLAVQDISRICGDCMMVI